MQRVFEEEDEEEIVQRGVYEFFFFFSSFRTMFVQIEKFDVYLVFHDL